MRSERVARRARAAAAVAVLSTLALVLFAASASADSPNPGSSNTGSAVLNGDGTVTVTVQGTWTWANQALCNPSRRTGVAIDWGDNTANQLTGNVFVGTAGDNSVHLDNNDCTNANFANSGTWGPLSHTFAAGTTSVDICVVTYHVDVSETPSSGEHSFIAGGSGHNTDNSVERNGVGCASIPVTIPTAVSPSDTTQGSAVAPAAVIIPPPFTG
jgi:hypothetical protein